MKKTLPHIKVFFVAAHREWRLSIQNNTGAPYVAAHNSTTHPDNGYLQQETVDNITNLATAMASDRAAIAHLTSKVKRFTAKLVTLNVKLVTVLQTQRIILGGRGGHVRGREHGAGAPAQTGAVAATMAKEQDLEPLIHYCWTCGPRCSHNSANCPTPSTSHIYTATKRDIQGGAEPKK